MTVAMFEFCSSLTSLSTMSMSVDSTVMLRVLITTSVNVGRWELLLANSVQGTRGVDTFVYAVRNALD